MKQYKYIPCKELEDYNDWEVIKIIEDPEVDMVVIMKENKPMKKEVYLSEATNQALINELIKRLESQV